MATLKGKIVGLSKQKKVPAIIIDVLNDRCSVRLSGRGKILKNLTYAGPQPTVGQNVYVDYQTGTPVVITSSSNENNASTITATSRPIPVASKAPVSSAPPEKPTSHVHSLTDLSVVEAHKVIVSDADGIIGVSDEIDFDGTNLNLVTGQYLMGGVDLETYFDTIYAPLSGSMTQEQVEDYVAAMVTGVGITITYNDMYSGLQFDAQTPGDARYVLLSNVSNDTSLASDSSTEVTTVHAVKTFVENAVTGLFDLKGFTDASANPNYPAALKGDAYAVSVAGKVGGASGKSVDVGDVYIAAADNAGGDEASVGTSWFVLEHNLQGAALVGVANTFTRGQFIDGSVDEVQLRVQGILSQTANLQTWENSAGLALAHITPGGGLWQTGDITVASATSAKWRGVRFQAATATITGNTAISDTGGFNHISISRPTASAALALTITHSATVYIENSPLGAGTGPATITNAYALWVDDGKVRFDGTLGVGVTPAVTPARAIHALFTATSASSEGIRGQLVSGLNYSDLSGILGILDIQANNNVTEAGNPAGIPSALRGNIRVQQARTVSELASIIAILSVDAGPTLTTWYGVLVTSPVQGASPGTLTTAYGIYVENQTYGATNYSIYTNSGLVRFGGVTSIVVDDAVNNAVTDVFTLTHSTSGSPSTNIGVGILAKVESTGGAGIVDAGGFNFYIDSTTTSSLMVRLRSASALTNVFRIHNNGYIYWALGTSGASIGASGSTQLRLAADASESAFFSTTLARINGDKLDRDTAIYAQTSATPIFYVDASAYKIGIGTSTPGALFDISDFLSGHTTVGAFRVFRLSSYTSTSTTYAGEVTLQTPNGNNSSSAYGGFKMQVQSGTTASAALTMFGAVFNAIWQSVSGVAPLGVVATMQAGVFSVSNIGTGTVTTGVAIDINTAVNSGGGAITTLYGIRIGNMNVGGTNYAIYTNAGLVHFGDSLDFASGKNITLVAGNIITDTTTGTKIGTATNQKLSFWGATPIVQPTNAIAAAAFVANTSGIVDDSATFGGYTVGQFIAAVKATGLIA